MLNIEGLESGYGEGIVLRNIRMTIGPGKVVCLMGRNGVGKTTLMKTLTGLLRTTKGRIEMNGADMTRLAPEKRARLGIGYVPQGRDLFGQLTVADNLLLGLEASGRHAGMPDDIFSLFPALRSMLSRRGGDLSGGQQQQVAIARALASRPRLLLLDEPMEGIQPSVVQEIERAIETVKRGGSTAILLVEQNLAFAASIADYFYILDKGTVVAEGGPSEINSDDLSKHLAI
jgi:urea transport system ATP-binding protein